MPPIDDDNYTVKYYEEDNTVDNVYLNEHDNVKKWSENSVSTTRRMLFSSFSQLNK